MTHCSHCGKITEDLYEGICLDCYLLLVGIEEKPEQRREYVVRYQSGDFFEAFGINV